MHTILAHTNSTSKLLFLGLVIVIFLGIGSAVYFNTWVLVGLPVLYFAIFLGIVDSTKLYYLLFATIPLSVAIEVGGGFSTDLPSEPLLIGLSFLTILHILNKQFPHLSALIKHPISILLLLHIAWTGITIITSDHRLIGIKFFLAKLWYVLPMYFMAGMLFIKRDNIHKAFKWSLYTMTALICITLIRHSLSGFSFRSVNFVMGPWFINHVAYASIIVILIPILLVIIQDTKYFQSKAVFFKAILIGLFFVGVLHSYTRAAILCLAIGFTSYFIVKWKLVKPSLIISLLILGAAIFQLKNNNQYLNFAPEYTKAISHHSFDKLITATSQLEDVSTMERVHRWIAGARMLADRPLMGYGPGSFYSTYKPYTVTGFKTYVSENFDHSGIHNYFLMIFVEQGIIGGIIFMGLTILLLIQGENLYHKVTDPADKRIVIAAVVGLIIINSLNLINDLIETDKVGSYYFAYAAIIVAISLKNNRLLFDSSRKK